MGKHKLAAMMLAKKTLRIPILLVGSQNNSRRCNGGSNRGVCSYDAWRGFDARAAEAR